MQRPPSPAWKHTLTPKGVKQSVKPLLNKSYRDKRTTDVTTELASNRVQYAHSGKKYKIEKVSLRRIDANLNDIAKLFIIWLFLKV